MYYVGIDVSANEHHCYIAEDLNFESGFSFRFGNNRSGYTHFISRLPQVPSNEIIVGLEATGHCSENLFKFLESSGLKTFCFNPYQSKEFAKGLSLRSTKTDKADAKVIARLCLAESFNPQLSTSYHYSELKSLTRHRSRLKKKHSSLLLSINRCVYIGFPELLKLVKNVNYKYVLHMIYEYPSAEDIAKAHLTRLSSVIAKASAGKCSKERAKEIKDLAKDSVGNFSDVQRFELKQTIDLLWFVKKQLKEVEKLIKEKMKEINSVILTVPGISYTLGSIILAEVGDFSHYESPSQLFAYAGLDPKISQSGTSKNAEGKINKKGSSYLRNALIQAADLIRKYDKTFYAYYWKKRDEGKHHFNALTHTARKLVRVLYKLMTENIEYVAQN